MKNWKENYDLVTTFALGEATPEQSAMLEEQMQNDPELRAEVEEIRRMGNFLSETLAHEPLPENVEYPKEVSLSAIGKAPKKRWSWMTRAAVCACTLVLVVSASMMFMPQSVMHRVGVIMKETAPNTQSLFQEKPGQTIQIPPLVSEPGGPEPFDENSEAEAPATNEMNLDAEAPQAQEEAKPAPETAPEQVGVDKKVESPTFDSQENAAQGKKKARGGMYQPEEKAGKDSFMETDSAPVLTGSPAIEVPAAEEAAEEVDAAEEAPVAAEEAPVAAKEAPVAAYAPTSDMKAAKQAPVMNSVPLPAASAPNYDAVQLGSPQMNGSVRRETTPSRAIIPPRMPAPIPPIPMPVPRPEPTVDRAYAADGNSFSMLEEQKFQKPEEEPFSTFGIDVDSASYTLMRQYMTDWGRKPPKESVRVEEYINYFKYDLKAPAEDSDCPFETTVEIQKHPWREGLYMAMVALKGQEIPEDKRPKLNLVFLLDVSGSMSDWNKLPLVKDGMMRLLDQLKPEDHVSIVTYANGTNIKLEPTPGTEKGKIEKAILELSAYGGTNGGEGIQRAYELARKNFDKEAENRVILCTDGDFNVGLTDISELQTLIESEAKSGVFLTVLGFGMGNFQDDRMKALASHGNGVYGYVDSRSEAKKMLCDELSSSLVTIAKDVKLQIDFNPAKVAAYRLIGYETRHMEAKDFHNDRKDSGDLGAGHSVVALYELVPVGGEIPQSEQVDESRYAPKPEEAAPEKKEEAKLVNDSPEWFFVKLRWKKPEANESTLKTFPVEFKEQPVSQNFQWASGTALFAMLLRESAYTGTANFDTVLEMIHPAVGESEQRKEFEELVKKAK